MPHWALCLVYDSINDTNLKISADPNTTFFDLMTTRDINILTAVGKLNLYMIVQKHKDFTF